MNEKKKIKALWKHEFRMCKGFLIAGCLIALLGLLYVYIISYIDRGFCINTCYYRCCCMGTVFCIDWFIYWHSVYDIDAIYGTKSKEYRRVYV